MIAVIAKNIELNASRRRLRRREVSGSSWSAFFVIYCLANEMAFCCERLTNIAASERQRARRFRNHLRSSAATPG
jgi:hypothetical protein